MAYLGLSCPDGTQIMGSQQCWGAVLPAGVKLLLFSLYEVVHISVMGQENLLAQQLFVSASRGKNS